MKFGGSRVLSIRVCFSTIYKQDMFLSELRALQPELCITAAYGNILPSKFLNIPPQG